MEKEFHTGQCFSVTPYGQVHYYKVLCAEKGQATLVAYVSIYSDGIYVGEGANISISDNAVEKQVEVILLSFHNYPFYGAVRLI